MLSFEFSKLVFNEWQSFSFDLAQARLALVDGTLSVECFACLFGDEKSFRVAVFLRLFVAFFISVVFS